MTCRPAPPWPAASARPCSTANAPARPPSSTHRCWHRRCGRSRPRSWSPTSSTPTASPERPPASPSTRWSIATRRATTRWLQLVFLQPDKFWAGILPPHRTARARHRRAIRAVGQPARQRRRGASTILNETIRRARSRALAEGPRGRAGCVGGVRDTAGDPQRSAGRTQRLPHHQCRRPAATNTAPSRPPCNSARLPPAPARAPEHGQHTEEILMELDIDWDDIEKAKEAGAIL